MHFVDPFREFDPLTGELPAAFPLYLHDFSERARRILKGWNRKQVDVALEQLNRWLDDAGEPPADDSDENGLIADSNAYLGHLVEPYESPSARIIRKIDLKLIPANWPDGEPQWSDYFAVLTLAIIGEILWLTQEVDFDDAEYGRAPDAGEAIGHAESLQIQALSIAQAISQQGRVAAQARHAATEAWKKKFTRLLHGDWAPLIETRKLSRYQAANRFYDEQIGPAISSGTAPEMKSRIKENVIRTLLEYERAHRHLEKP